MSGTAPDFLHASRWSARAASRRTRAGFAHAMRIVLRILLPWNSIPIEAGGPERFPCADIVEMRLSFEPTRFDHERHRCDIKMRDGTRATIWSTHFVKIMDFENRAATYTPLVRALVTRTAAANPACEFRAGKKALSYWAQFVFLLAMFALLVFVIAALGGVAFTGLVVVKLIVIVGFIPLLMRCLHKNRPGQFRPGAISPTFCRTPEAGDNLQNHH